MDMHIETVERLGELVRAARRSQGLRQQDLAVVAGTGERFIRELEAGKPTVRLQSVLDVTSALGIEFVARVPDEGEP